MILNLDQDYMTILKTRLTVTRRVKHRTDRRMLLDIVHLHLYVTVHATYAAFQWRFILIEIYKQVLMDVKGKVMNTNLKSIIKIRKTT